jgi:hypothetical protein
MKKRILSLLIVIICLFSVTACKPNDIYNPPNTNIIDGGTHIKEKTDTDKYIIKGGTTQYKIVLPQNSTSAIRIVADEFVNFFLESTGVQLQIITDDGIEYTSDGKYFSIGQTNLLNGAGIEIDKTTLKGSGYQIITKGDTIFAFGGTDNGSIYAVYHLLNELLGYEFFYNDCYSLNKNVKDIKLMKYNYLELPDFEYRIANYSFIKDDKLNMYRTRTMLNSDIIMDVNGKMFHNSLNYISSPPPEVINDPYYDTAKVKWVADGQLCYTAHGDEKAYDMLLQTCLHALKNSLKASPDKNLVSFTIEDNKNFCSCDACKAIIQKYKANSATVILFLNDLNRMVREWFNTEEGLPYKRDLEIIFFAYNKTLEAPAVFNNQTNTWEAVNGIKCDDGVSVWYAPIEMDFMKSIYHSDNKAIYNIIESWKHISKNIYMWIYSTNFKHYLAPYDTFNSMQETYQYLKKINTVFLLDQAQGNSGTASTGWSILKAYLNYKLAWNVNENVGELIENFFENYFCEAAPEMFDFFNSYRFYSESFKAKGILGGTMSVHQDVKTEDIFPKPVLLNWKSHIDAAIEKIKSLRISNPKKYQMIYDHIAIERLSVLYYLIELYNHNISPADILNYKLLFKEDADRLGLLRTSENQYALLAETYAKWGI